MRKRLVIDADLLHAASADTASKRALDCCSILLSVLKKCHRTAVSRELEAEWRAHVSIFSATWRNQMESRRKIESIQPERHVLRDRLDQVFPGHRNRDAADRDLHLIELALAADGIVLSLDDAAKRLFENAKTKPPVLRKITWHNPVKDVEATLKWLRSGARPDQVPE